MNWVLQRFDRLHHNIWYRVCMVNAYLAYHRGDKYECANYENEARKHERALQLLAFQKEWVK